MKEMAKAAGNVGNHFSMAQAWQAAKASWQHGAWQKIEKQRVANIIGVAWQHRVAWRKRK